MMALAKGRVLICDDEAGIRDIVARLVRQEGYEAIEAPDGVAALAALQQHAPHVLFLDICMPHLHGIEVLQRAKQVAPQLRVVMLATSAAAADVEAAFRCGADGYLFKPFRHEELLQRLRQAFERLPGASDPAGAAPAAERAHRDRASAPR